MKAAAAMLLAFGCAGANAQQAAPCPKPGDVAASHMYGFWTAEIGGRHAGTLLLDKHPEFAGSFRGAISRDGTRALVAGDVDDGELTLEESADGKRIGATWLGQVVDGSCGREIRGTWQQEGSQVERPFILKKQ
jgi:hypothetical protein